MIEKKGETECDDPGDIPFEWEIASLDEFMKENGHLSKYARIINRDHDMERVCRRITGDFHDYDPVLFSVFPGWEFRCSICNHLKSDYNISNQLGMHDAHKTITWEQSSFSDICYQYLEWELGECRGSVAEVRTISYCVACRVIHFYASDDMCNKCGYSDITYMDDYQFFEFKIWIKEYVFEKLRDAGLK